MEKDFTPYEQTLALKELGFREHCAAFYSTEEELCFKWETYGNMSTHSLRLIQCPTFSQAFRWFREKYNMLANVYSNASGFLFEYHDTIGGTHRYDSGFTGPNDSGCWDTYQEAELECLKKLIEIVKKK